MSLVGRNTGTTRVLAQVALRGGGVLVATHDPRVLPWSDRVVLLRDGRIEAEGTPRDVAGSLSTD